jgi:hypothetical protein
MPFTPAEALLEFTMRTAKDGKSVMTVQRPALIEPCSIYLARNTTPIADSRST